MYYAQLDVVPHPATHVLADVSMDTDAGGLNWDQLASSWPTPTQGTVGDESRDSF